MGLFPVAAYVSLNNQILVIIYLQEIVNGYIMN